MTTIQAIDLSHHNDVSSFDQVKASGVIGVFHKATQGTGFVDDKYAERMEAALAAGLKWGAYHFLEHGNIDAQMEHFVATANLPVGSRVALDYEADTDGSEPTLDDLHDAIEWLDINRPDLQITVYGGSLLKQHVGRDYYGDLSQTALWLAHYTTGTPSWPTNTWPHYTLWQFTDSATVPGINGNVDGNHFNGSEENCALWFGPAPQPQPEPAPEIQTITMTVPDGIQVIINGEVVF